MLTYKTLFLTVYFIGLSASHLLFIPNCPCNDESLCNIISENFETEIFIFSVSASNFKHYDFTRVTTIAVTYEDISPDLVCFAHLHKTRVVSMGNFPVTNLTNPSTFQPWIDQQIKHIQSSYLDGINIDFESAIPQNDTQARDGFTQLIYMLTSQLKEIDKAYQVSIDFAWSPDCIDQRCYDYLTLANIVDLAFVMSYDERSQIYGECVAWANSAINNTAHGVNKFLSFGIPASKLILGVPWYGYEYPCINYDPKTYKCSIKKVPFRGVACSDAAGREISYSAIIGPDYLGNAVTDILWEPTAQSPYFTFKTKDNTISQMWFDNPKSLRIKYDFAVKSRLAGVGMWEADGIDYSNKTQVHEMWGAMPGRGRLL